MIGVPVQFFPREIALMRKLFHLRDFKPGTKEHIARQLDGRKASTATRRFVEKMINLSCLTFTMTGKVRVMNRYEERPLYDRDRKRMAEVWQQTEAFKFSYEILDEQERVI